MAITDELTDFERDLAAVLNKYSVDNDLNTPDFILADMVRSFLQGVQRMQTQRANWGQIPRVDGSLGEQAEARESS